MIKSEASQTNNITNQINLDNISLPDIKKIETVNNIVYNINNNMPSTVSQNQEPASMDYFDTAIFIGDDSLNGFNDYLVNSRFSPIIISNENMAVLTDYSPIAPDISDNNNDTQETSYNIYIITGKNHLGLAPDEFKDTYNNYLSNIKNSFIHKNIYLQTIIPFGNEFLDNAALNNDIIYEYNKIIMEIAIENNCEFLNLYQVFSGNNHSLKVDATPNGIAFFGEYYDLWLDFLRCHKK